MALTKKQPEAKWPPASYPNLFVGTSGWAYPTWRPGFYPAGIPARQFLSFYASRFNSVEVNYTFRTLPSPETLNEWLAATPAGFRFSFKAPQQITHFSRLVDCGIAVDEFFKVLEPVRKARKLGPVFFQLPPNFKADLDRLDAFLRIAPLCARRRPPIAFEFRHESWFTNEVYTRLRKSRAALCVAESDDLQTPEVHPASGCAYFRLRRNGGYTDAEIGQFALHLTQLAQNREVYAYFKHEDVPTGALNAAALVISSVVLLPASTDEVL